MKTMELSRKLERKTKKIWVKNWSASRRGLACGKKLPKRKLLRREVKMGASRRGQARRKESNHHRKETLRSGNIVSEENLYCLQKPKLQNTTLFIFTTGIGAAIAWLERRGRIHTKREIPRSKG